VVSIPFFESCVAKTDVCFFQFWGGDLYLVNNVHHITISVQGARIVVMATTDPFRFIQGFQFVVKFSLIVVGDYGPDVAHAAKVSFRVLRLKIL